jgi:hypothetical protein
MMGEIRNQVDQALMDAANSGLGPASQAGLVRSIQGLITATQLLADHLDTSQDSLRTN